MDAVAGVEAILVFGRLHLAGDRAFLVRCVEAGDRPRARFSGEQIGPTGLHISAQRRHQTQSRHDNPAHSHSFRSEEHTSELQSLMRISYAVFCLKKKKIVTNKTIITRYNRCKLE